MSAGARIAAFVAALAVVLAGAVAVGRAVGPAPPRPAGDAEAHPSQTGDHGGQAVATGDPVRGLSLAAGGLRIAVDTPRLRAGRAARVAFRVLGEDGRPVRAFDVEHEKRMHLVLARRDLTGFRHLHPRMSPDGTWIAAVRLDAAGPYRLFADFARAGRRVTLGSDVVAGGPSSPLRPLPPVEHHGRSDGGLDVTLRTGAVHAGRVAILRFVVARGSRAVAVEPYLGARGHLVALREGDLGFLHVHPESEDEVAFVTTFPTPGRYRLFLQVRAGGRVHTAPFTVEAR